MTRPHLLTCLTLAVFHSIVQATPAAQTGIATECASRPDTAAWIEKAVTDWQTIRRDALHLRTEVLVIDALLPDWQSRAFDAKPVSVIALLREAVRDQK